MTPLHVHAGKMEKRLQHWGAELDQLAQTALSIQATQKAAFDERIADLRAKLDLAQNKLEALRGSGEQKWEDFKDDLDACVHDLEAAFKKK